MEGEKRGQREKERGRERRGGVGAVGRARMARFGFRVSGFEFRVSNFGFRISGFGLWFRASGLGFRAS